MRVRITARGGLARRLIKAKAVSQLVHLDDHHEIVSTRSAVWRDCPQDMLAGGQLSNIEEPATADLPATLVIPEYFWVGDRPSESIEDRDLDRAPSLYLRPG